MTNAAFARKKAAILQQLAVPDEAYTDASPKGSVDVEIRDLIDLLNAHDGIVTTSSCAGRLSIFLEGSRGAESSPSSNKSDTARDASRDQVASKGGKGGGGRWLFVSHVPVHESGAAEHDFHHLFGLQPRPATTPSPPPSTARFVHLKFEPMILHILTSSLPTAQLLLTAAQAAGFRESGLSSVGSCPIVAVRSAGLAMDCIVGVARDVDGEGALAMVDEVYLQTMVGVANDRFVANSERIRRFEGAVGRVLAQREAPGRGTGKSGEWEDADTRRDRKRAEGLLRRAEKKNEADNHVMHDQDVLDEAPLDLDGALR